MAATRLAQLGSSCRELPQTKAVEFSSPFCVLARRSKLKPETATVFLFGLLQFRDSVPSVGESLGESSIVMRPRLSLGAVQSVYRPHLCRGLAWKHTSFRSPSFSLCSGGLPELHEINFGTTGSSNSFSVTSYSRREYLTILSIFLDMTLHPRKDPA